MKKGLLTIVTIVLFYSSLFAGVIEKSYSFKSYRIMEMDSYQTIVFPNTLVTGKTGEPVLPYRAVLLLLPPGEAVRSIEVIGEDPGRFSVVSQTAGPAPLRSEERGFSNQQGRLSTEYSVPEIQSRDMDHRLYERIWASDDHHHASAVSAGKRKDCILSNGEGAHPYGI